VSHDAIRQALIHRLEGHETYFCVRNLGEPFICGSALEFRIPCVGRHRKNPNQDDWKKKLHPVFLELAEVNREFERRWAEIQKTWSREQKRTGSGPQTRTQNEIAARMVRDKVSLEQWFEERLRDINNRYSPIPYNPLAYNYLTLDPPKSDAEGILEYLHFHRHGESLRATETQDAKGDLDAWDKIARTQKDARILSFGKGPIKPFQEDVVHRQLLQLAICYEREQLTAEELAQCFDTYCACPKKNHDADALRKMRDRFEAELRAE